jgi:mediator of RNA polymerase II transcription subunit 5
MADLAVSQGAAQLSLNDAPMSQTIPSSQQAGLAADMPGIASSVVGIAAPLLPTFKSQVPLSHSLSVQMAWAIQSNRWTASDPNMNLPPDNHLTLLRLGPYFAQDSTEYLQQLIRVSISQVQAVPPEEKVARWLFLTERLPSLLKWWKGDQTMEWSYPVSYALTLFSRKLMAQGNLKQALSAAFVAEKDSVSGCNGWISTTLQSLTLQAESDDEAGGFVQPEGWRVVWSGLTRAS